MRRKADEEIGGKSAGLSAPHSRRTFLKGMGLAAGAGMMIGNEALAQDTEGQTESPDVKFLGRKRSEVTFKVNGKNRAVKVEPRETLLDVLRMQTETTGPKEVCDRGSCGCCTVLMDGKAVTSCMTLAIDAEGCEVVTSEGIAADPKYKALIDSFHEHDAAQCGFCIPGFLVRSAAFLEENASPNMEEIRQGLSGNICRCGTYTKLLSAVEGAAKGGAK